MNTLYEIKRLKLESQHEAEIKELRESKLFSVEEIIAARESAESLYSAKNIAWGFAGFAIGIIVTFILFIINRH